MEVHQMIIEKAYAKVNLFINVLDTRKDGYHNLEMVNAKIDLHDTIKLEKTNSEGLVLIRSNDLFLSNQNNIVFDTAAYIMHRFMPDKGVIIDIEKKIPFGAGLAGNSADAAAIIKGINKLFELNLSYDEMVNIGVQFGADIPYCLIDDQAIVESIGEVITKVKLNLKGKQLFLLNPRVYVQTKDIFSLGDRNGFDNVDSTPIRNAIKSNDQESFIINMHNSLQKLSLDFNEDVKEAFEIAKSRLGETGLIMTGSGSTFIKIVNKDEQEVLKFVEDYREKYFVSVYNFL